MGRIDLENFPTSSSALRMLDDVSTGFYENSYVGKWLYQVMGLEYDDAFMLAQTLPEQFFPETATWGLRYHEEKWGLPIRESLEDEERRRLIYQKRDYRAPMTPHRMEYYLQNATGFAARISDCHDPGDDGWHPAHPNIFRAVFEGEGTLDVKKAKELLKKIKQSHTTFFIYDKVADVMDNRNLEQMLLWKLTMRTQVPFWGCYIFDGAWNLDGSILLNQQRRYNLILGLKYYQGAFYELAAAHTHLFDGTWNFDGSILLDNIRRIGMLKTHMKISGPETSCRAAVAASHRADFWQLLSGSLQAPDSGEQDGCIRRRMDASARICLEACGPAEKIRDGPVEIRRNLWRFDGAELLDGSRKFNAMQRLEVL